jgi:hypothetical protein
VVWLEVLWTSSEVPLMDAIWPEVPGNRRAVALPPAPPLLFVGAFVVDVVEADDELPQAARVTATAPTAVRARARRTGERRRARSREVPAGRAVDGSVGLFIALP